MQMAVKSRELLDIIARLVLADFSFTVEERILLGA
jgi:hypothetical protein